MLTVPETLLEQFESLLIKHGVDESRFAEYKKWFRYFLDFSSKYQLPDSKSEQIRLFSEKLRQKKQSEYQRQQAIRATFLYFEILQQEKTKLITAASVDQEALKSLGSAMTQYSSSHQRKSFYLSASYEETSESPEWDKLIATMAAEIPLLCYPPVAGRL